MPGGGGVARGCAREVRRLLSGRPQGAHAAPVARTPPAVRVVWYLTAVLLIALALPAARSTRALTTSADRPGAAASPTVAEAEAPPTTAVPTTVPAPAGNADGRSQPAPPGAARAGAATGAGAATAAAPVAAGPEPGIDCDDGAGPRVDDVGGDTAAVDLAERLVGDGVTVTGATFTGAPAAAGAFACGQDGIGLDAGIVLSTGAAAEAVGPGAGSSAGTDHGLAGADDLTSLAGSGTADAAILDIDVVADLSTITFDYVFASGEYHDSAGAGLADVVALLVNGVNCAVVPGTLEPVSATSVPRDQPEGQAGPSWFRNSPGGAALAGMTSVLSCPGSVTAGESNRLRLAVADTGDPVVDSAVFLGEASLRAVDNQPPVAADDELVTAADVAGQLDVLANDRDPDGDPLTVLSHTPAEQGAVVCEAAGTCTYT
ncbi:MAG TPA: choice-of-anchor L domain-containing protein, partial [Acidimicrobiales bacterium]|nr:choice-of-anchor L domain-containing protein [Acidimicrobiales bacterium]